jgi:DNA-binding NarL/FixJ family response regulator
MLRESLEYLISGQSDMEVVGTSDDASKAPELCRQLKPDLVLMDVVTANDSNGIKYAAEIRKELPNIKIVIMTSLPEITFLDEARKAGVHSYIYKNSGNKHLFYVIRSTMEGIGIYPGATDSPAYNFTDREISIIRLVCQGKTREEIARELGISEFNLRTNITSILDKTGFDSITKFALYAVSRDLIIPDPN